MRAKLPVYLVDIIGEVVASMATDVAPLIINYQYGRQIKVLQSLQAKDASTTLGDTKYPLLALFQDFPEQRGDTSYYAIVTIPKIVIACLATESDTTAVRYEKNFKPILYPVYSAFLKYLARHKNILESDPDAIKHTKWDRPGSQPRGTQLHDIVDAIEINNLKLTLSQTKTC